MPSIAALLSAARRRSFVGRDNEIRLFESLLKSPNPEYVLVHIHGPGGQGKTTLAKHLADICIEHGAHQLLIDAREIEPHPIAFLESVKTALGKAIGSTGNPDSNVFEDLGRLSGRTVLFIDTFEKIAPLDDWIRVDFLPQLPSNVLTVITSRNAPGLSWTTDAGWRMLMRTVQLRNFTPSESETYLRQRNLPEDKIRPIIEFTHGHPLAISVVADIYEQYPDKNFSPDQSPDLIRTLLQLFVRQVPSPMHRAALEVCALVNLLTESLLADVMGVEDVSELFNWLCGLSFISIGKEGIYPHDIAREALCADLRWRHPDWYAELHNRIRHYYHRKLRETTGEGQRKVLFDLLYLHRLNAVVKPFFDWQESGSFWVDIAQEADMPALRDMVRRHEDAGSLMAFDFWAKHPAGQIWVWRDGARQANAFVLKINLHEINADEVKDPIVQQLLVYQKKHLPLRQGEQMVAFRFWMAGETHQNISPLQSSMFLTIVQYYFTPGLAVSMLSVSQPEFWKPGFNYADLHHLTELDYSVNSMTFGWYMHDWRVRPPLAWLELLGKREIDAEAAAGLETIEAPPPSILVLSEEEFGESLSDALKNLHNNNQLQQNPLLRAKLVVQEAGEDAPDARRIAVLKEKILTLLKDIEASPVDGKYHRVLYRTFVNPVGSQEKTADFLNMSFSTYRRYLQAGVQRMVELMWARELS